MAISMAFSVVMAATLAHQGGSETPPALQRRGRETFARDAKPCLRRGREAMDQPPRIYPEDLQWKLLISKVMEHLFLQRMVGSFYAAGRFAQVYW
eukprot:s3236_g3.t1